MVERQLNRASRNAPQMQINRGDEPADFRVLVAEYIVQHDPVHQKRRRDAERNQVGQRIEFAAKRAFVPAHARDAAVEQIENAREQNERQRDLDLAVVAVFGSAPRQFW
jgi:hypothetical protein